MRKAFLTRPGGVVCWYDILPWIWSINGTLAAWPDWATFRPLGGYFIWALLKTFQKYIDHLFFHDDNNCQLANFWIIFFSITHLVTLDMSSKKLLWRWQLLFEKAVHPSNRVASQLDFFWQLSHSNTHTHNDNAYCPKTRGGTRTDDLFFPRRMRCHWATPPARVSSTSSCLWERLIKWTKSQLTRSNV
jgi:hypothetical protein